MTITNYPFGPAAYVGIDPSLTSTGIAVHDRVNGEGITTHRIQSKGTKQDSWATRGQRILKIADQIEQEVPIGSLVVVESPSYGSQGGAQHDRAGLWWEIHHRLRDSSCTVVSATPSQRMKYVTGTGRADKDKVLAAAIRRYPDLDITGNDIADAVIFMAMAARLAGEPIEVAIQAMREVTQKLATQLEDN